MAPVVSIESKSRRSPPFDYSTAGFLGTGILGRSAGSARSELKPQRLSHGH